MLNLYRARGKIDYLPQLNYEYSHYPEQGMKQVGTPLIRHNLHANKCCSKTVLELWEMGLWRMEFAKLPD